MKKIRKITIALLIVLCMAFSAVALTACIGPAGAQGVQGEQGPVGESGKSAWELYKEYYLATYGMEYSGTEADWYASIINPMAPHEHSFIESGSYYASMGTGVIVYKKCSGCLEAGDFVFVENATPSNFALNAAMPSPISFALADHSAFSFMTISVDAANADKTWEFALEGQLAIGAPVSVSVDGVLVSEGAISGNLKTGMCDPYSFEASLTEGTHRVVIRYGRHLDQAPRAVLSSSEKVGEGANVLVLGANEITALADGTSVYTFNVSEDGDYKFSIEKGLGVVIVDDYGFGTDTIIDGDYETCQASVTNEYTYEYQYAGNVIKLIIYPCDMFSPDIDFTLTIEKIA